MMFIDDSGYIEYNIKDHSIIDNLNNSRKKKHGRN